MKRTVEFVTVVEPLDMPLGRVPYRGEFEASARYMPDDLFILSGYIPNMNAAHLTAEIVRESLMKQLEFDPELQSFSLVR